MKYKYSIIIILFCFSLAPLTVDADPLTYKIEGETVSVVDCDEIAFGDLVIPSNYNGKPIISIGRNAFNSCHGLTSVTIGDGVASIKSNAFLFCSSLTSVEIPNSVNSIGDDAFSGCYSLTSVSIPDSLTSIGNRAFSGCKSLTSVEIPDSVTSIGNEAYSGCSSLTSVTIGAGVTSIGGGAFLYCNRLTSVKIPNGVVSIGRSALSECSSLTSVTIPGSVTNIGSMAFSGCISLKDITFLGNAPSSIVSDVFKNLPSEATITVTAGATGFGETYGGLPVKILKNKLLIKSFNNHTAPFSLTFETQLDSTYKIEASHDLKEWGEISEVQGTGSSFKFIERRKALFTKQYYRVKMKE